MARLAISLLGSFSVTLDGFARTAFATDKTRALLAYLAVESGRPHRRAALAALFWPDRPETMARNNLRQALFQLRQALGECPADTPFLLLEAEEVRLNPTCDHWLDVSEFNRHIAACWTHHPSGLGLCESCCRRLERLVELYRGEFMHGFSLPSCLDFDLWQVITQEACHHRVLDALTRLSNHYESRKRYDHVLEYSRRKIELVPWSESAHRRRMRTLALSGQPGEALLQYEACHEILQREFGISPCQETIDLYERIQAGRLDALAEPVSTSTEEPPVQPAPELHPGDVPAPALSPLSHDPSLSAPGRENTTPSVALSQVIPSIDEFSNTAFLKMLPRLSDLSKPEANRCLWESLITLALEIKKLRSGQVLSPGDLRRLRKALRAAFAALDSLKYPS